MRKLKNEPNKVLISFLNGAISVFNIAKRTIEFQTEAGHAETVFDIKFNPKNKDIIASCSYDGTARIWDAN
jgi:WD40 repeat protein